MQACTIDGINENGGGTSKPPPRQVRVARVREKRRLDFGFRKKGNGSAARSNGNAWLADQGVGEMLVEGYEITD